MPKDLKDFPRPPSDNGRGLHGSASVRWSGGSEGYDHWINELKAMGIKWFKVLDEAGDSLPFCEKLLEAGIFPIVRIIRQDPPPNDLPEPNPGHIGTAEEETIQRLINAGVRYLETNNEPNLEAEWKHHAMPGESIETAKLVALNWLFDARLILEMGGLPGLPAVSAGGNMDLLGALVALGRQDILLEGCWVALHNYCGNHPLAYPDDPVNRTGQPLEPEQFEQGLCTPWVWWNGETGRVDTLDEINELRASGKSPTASIMQDHFCFREFEYYDALAIKYLGHSIPIISTEGGYLVGRRQDSRYPRVTPEAHRDQTVAMLDFMQRQAPDFYFAATPWLLFESSGWEEDAWHSSFWNRALRNGSDGRNGIPPIPMPGSELADHLPVVEAIKAMPSLPRRLPGTQPVPPAHPVIAQPAPPVQPIVVSTAAQVPPSPAPAVAQAPRESGPEAAEPLRAEYVVAPGDTLAKIAKRFGTTSRALAALNQIAAPNLLHPGQVLLIPTPLARGREGERRSPEKSHPAVPVTPPEEKPAKAPPASLSTPELKETDRRETAVPPAPQPIQSPPEKPAVSSEWSTSFPSIPPPPAPAAPPAAAVEEAKPRPARAPAPIPPALSPSLLFSSIPVPRLDWDPRLDALRVDMEPAQISPGQLYWKLIRAEYQGPDESDGKHHIYFKVEDEQGKPLEYQRVWQGWPDDKTDATTNEAGETNIPLWASFSPEHEAGPYTAWVDGLPSDRVTGLGLPLKRQVNFLLTWRRVLA